MGHIPLWLKIGFLAFVLAWIPCYANYYGLYAFFWFCDIANFMIVIALWCESRLIFSWQAVSVLLFQTLWVLDFVGRLLLGKHLIGGTEYAFNPDIPFFIRLLTLFHVITPAVLLWALWRLGYDRRGYYLQIVTAWAVLPLSFFCFGPDKDVNWVWGPFHRQQTLVSPGWYLAACMLFYPCVVYTPTHLTLSWLLGKRKRPGRPCATATDKHT